MQDTLMYVKKLEAVGIPREQAEAQVEIMSDFVDSKFATKQDLTKESDAIRSEMRLLGSDIRAEMQQIKTDLRLEIKDMAVQISRSMAIWAGVIIAANNIMLAIILKIIH